MPRLPLEAHAADWQHYLAWAARLNRPLPALLEFVQDNDPHNLRRDAALFNTWLTALSQAAPSPTPTLRTFFLADDGAIPNNPRLPLLVYPRALDLPPDEEPAQVAERLFTGNGWGKTWRNGIYPYHHYHSTAHEVLAICHGQAKVQFGGEQGTVLTVQAGDVVVIPAGCGHKNLGSGPEFLVVGAYPPGQSPDMGYGRPEERQRLAPNIVHVPLPATDPVYGRHGPLLTHWR